MSNALAHRTDAEPSRDAGTGRRLDEVLVPIPRRPRLIAPTDAVRPPRLHTVAFHATVGQCVARLALWLSVVVRVVLGRLVDKVRGRDTIQRRAERSREALERVGGTICL